MEPRRKSRFWRLLRIYFRRFRIGVWLTILLLVGGLVYLNQVGLPRIIKKPLLEKLRERGIDLQFSRLRLQWYHGIVAENVRFGSTTNASIPHLTVSEVEVQLDQTALRRFQIQVDSLVLNQGRLVWPIFETNREPRQLAVENIQTDLEFLPNDEWALRNFTATFAGARVQLSGNITNASEVRNWKVFQGERVAAPGLWQNRLRILANAVEQIHFKTSPELKLQVQGDARDLGSFHLRLGVKAPPTTTPWGRLAGAGLRAWLSPVGSNGQSRAELELKTSGAQTEWGTVTNLQLGIQATSVEGQAKAAEADLQLRGGLLASEWGSVSNFVLKAHWVNSLTNALALQGLIELDGEQVRSRWANVRLMSLTGRFTGTGQEPGELKAGEPPWLHKLAAYHLDWNCCVTDLQTPSVASADLSFSGQWEPPVLSITNFDTYLYQGRFQAQAALNTDTRNLKFKLVSSFDQKEIASLLTPTAQHWLAEYSWETPPQITAEGSLMLPAWTNRHPDWRTDVQPTVRLNGEFQLGNCAFRELPAMAACSHFIYSNSTWRLPDLAITRPEGTVQAEHITDERTRDFYWRFRGFMDAKALRPILDRAEQMGLDMFEFSRAPYVDAEAWGRWLDHDRLGMRGQVALTNFFFRQESFENAQTKFQYTNKFLQFTESHAQRGIQDGRADGIGIDLASQRIYLTNCHGVADPQLVARLIGPYASEAIEPYVFGLPPAGVVNGFVSVRDSEDVDLSFRLNGGPFHWWKFNVPQISGEVRWAGTRVLLNGVHSQCYGGSASGSASFDFGVPRGTDVHFDATLTDGRLENLMRDLTGTNSRPEGLLNGHLWIMRANSDDRRSWNGVADLRIEDGLLWDIPVFGVFSPVLNGISPGLGSSRASAAAGVFVITNGVIRSDDLEIRSSATRLQYRGEVDTQGQLSARVEAELLRDMWLVGPIVSTVFWPVTKIFEYKVTGPLGQPKIEPVYLIPKIVLMPLHPLRSIRELFPEGPGPVRTNAPPLFRQ